MNTKPFRVGMVGLGLVSEAHAKGYESHPRAQIAAVCDLDEKRAEAFAVRHDVPRVYGSFDAMLADPGVNAIDIATPTHLHVPMTLAAARVGRHVHCEKPFCRSVGEGLLACQAARQRGVILAVGESYVFLSSHMQARELMDAGEIGRPMQIRQRHGAWLERQIAAIHTGPTNRSWRIHPEQSGGGEYPWIFDHAVHFFSAAEYLLQDEPIAEVYAVTSQDHGGPKRQGAAHDPYTAPGVDIPIITWKYRDRARQGVWARAERLNGKYDYRRGFGTIISGETGMIEVLGEGGANLDWQGREVHLIMFREGKAPVTWRFDEGGDDVWDSEISYYSRAHITQIHHFVDSALTGRDPRYKGEDGVHAVQCTLAAILSAQQGRPVRVEEVPEDFTAYGPRHPAS